MSIECADNLRYTKDLVNDDDEVLIRNGSLKNVIAGHSESPNCLMEKACFKVILNCL